MRFGLALLLLASAASAEPKVGAHGQPHDLPAVSSDGTYAAPLMESDGGSESVGLGVQLFRTDGTTESLMAITYRESNPSGVWSDNAPRVRREVPKRVAAINERLQGFVTLPKPLVQRESVSDKHRFHVRFGGLDLVCDDDKLTVSRGDTPLVEHVLPTKRDRDPKNCPKPHAGWIAALYVDTPRHAIVLHQMYEGADVCSEPIDDWVALAIPQ